MSMFRLTGVTPITWVDVENRNDPQPNLANIDAQRINHVYDTRHNTWSNLNFNNRYISQNDLYVNPLPIATNSLKFYSGFANNFENIRRDIRVLMSHRAGCWAAAGMTLLLRKANLNQEIILNSILEIRNASTNPRKKGEKYDTLMVEHYGAQRVRVDTINRFSSLKNNTFGLFDLVVGAGVKHTYYYEKNRNIVTLWNPWEYGEVMVDVDQNTNNGILRVSYID